MPLSAHLLIIAFAVVVALPFIAQYFIEKKLEPHQREGYTPPVPTESAPATAVETASLREQALNDNELALEQAA